MKLVDKVAIVTGAASGMGKAIAELFAEQGAKVVVSDLNAEQAQAVVDGIVSEGGIAVAIAANVALEDDVRRLFEGAVSCFGTVDILVNNAGVMDNFVPAAEITDELWERVFAVNATGPMRTTRQALPIFLDKNSGTIVNIASAGGLFGSRAGAAYTASKHAVVGFTKNVGFQYAKSGIRCNAIAPGAVKTNISASLTAVNPFGAERAQTGMVINPGLGEPEDIARVALFLASDDSSFVNGTTITADAGWTAY
jgi:NAD(P)-dependent dehydrogenase (short-subunit alcohol dehydrogenase family)